MTEKVGHDEEEESAWYHIVIAGLTGNLERERCPIGSGMTLAEEIPRLATLARNDSSALRMTVWMVVEVLAWGAVVAAGGFVVAAADGFVEWAA